MTQRKNDRKEWKTIVFAVVAGAALILLPGAHAETIRSVGGFFGAEECDDIPAAACFGACGYACKAPGVFCGFKASCVVEGNKAVCECTCKLCTADML